MADEPTLGEVVRRLERVEELLRELALRVVPVDIHARAEREIERRFTEIERDLAEERELRRAANADIRAQLDKTGTNWRQAIYSGLIPGVLFLIGILLQLKGGK